MQTLAKKFVGRWRIYFESRRGTNVDFSLPATNLRSGRVFKNLIALNIFEFAIAEQLLYTTLIINGVTQIN